MGDVGIWVSIVALVVALYAAVSSRRSAAAAERSADASSRSAGAAERSASASEGLVALEHQRERERWVTALSETFPDYTMLPRVLAELPPYLKPEWKAMVLSAARRAEKVHLDKALPLLEGQYFPEWEAMMKETEDEGEVQRRGSPTDQ